MSVQTCVQTNLNILDIARTGDPPGGELACSGKRSLLLVREGNIHGSFITISASTIWRCHCLPSKRKPKKGAKKKAKRTVRRRMKAKKKKAPGRAPAVTPEPMPQAEMTPPPMTEVEPPAQATETPPSFGGTEPSSSETEQPNN